MYTPKQRKSTLVQLGATVNIDGYKRGRTTLLTSLLSFSSMFKTVKQVNYIYLLSDLSRETIAQCSVEFSAPVSEHEAVNMS